MEQRIEDLECKLMAAEDLLETLNLTVFRQQQTIERLVVRLEALERRMQDVRPSSPLRPEDEIPPHY